MKFWHRIQIFCITLWCKISLLPVPDSVISLIFICLAIVCPQFEFIRQKVLWRDIIITPARDFLWFRCISLLEVQAVLPFPVSDVPVWTAYEPCLLFLQILSASRTSSFLEASLSGTFSVPISSSARIVSFPFHPCWAEHLTPINAPFHSVLFLWNGFYFFLCRCKLLLYCLQLLLTLCQFLINRRKGIIDTLDITQRVFSNFNFVRTFAFIVSSKEFANRLYDADKVNPWYSPTFPPVVTAFNPAQAAIIASPASFCPYTQHSLYS